jgi:hypothetical protein
MVEYLPSREDVIAIRCGGRLEREELDTRPVSERTLVD